jgi:hypothetical protein
MERTKQQVRGRRDPESKASLTMLIRIMEFPGGSRPDSPRQKLLDRGVARALEAGAEVKSVYIQDGDLPTCVGNCEFEDGIAPCAGNTLGKVTSQHILLIATPDDSDGHTSRNRKRLGWADHLIRVVLSGLNRMVSGLTGLLLAFASWLAALSSQIRDPSPAHKSQAKGIVNGHYE